MDAEAIKKIVEEHEKWINTREADGERAELCGQDLSNADMKEAVLIMADLSGVDLKGANLVKANLKGVDLKGAHMRDAALRGINLIEANLNGTNLTKANIRDGVLRDANMRSAHCIDTDLREANLIGADLSEANLRGADLRGATLTQVNLTNADLSNAMLRGASFRESNMQGVNLNNADLSHADLSFVNLTNADLRNVDMRHATIVRAKMKGIKIENPELHDLNLDSDSYEYIPNEIRVRFEKTWKYLNFKEIAKRDYAEIIIKLIPEYRSTGLTLLNYFPTLLEKKYPDQKVKVSFDYKGLDVFMMIDIVQGSREILLKAMKEYGSLLTGSLPVNEYTEDKILIMEIENELKCAQFRIDAEKEIAVRKYKNNPDKADIIKLKTLCFKLEEALQSKPIPEAKAKVVGFE